MELVIFLFNYSDSMNRSKTHGSIEIGKMADFVVINAKNWEHIIYQFGLSPIHSVIKKGKVIHSNH
jgi:imidazolonepropionase